MYRHIGSVQSLQMMLATVVSSIQLKGCCSTSLFAMLAPWTFALFPSTAELFLLWKVQARTSPIAQLVVCQHATVNLPIQYLHLFRLFQNIWPK